MKLRNLRPISIVLSCFIILTMVFPVFRDGKQAIADSRVALSLVIRNRTPTIKAGDTIEIEVFVSGSGIPSKHKLAVVWSSSHLVDRTDPGHFTVGGNEPVKFTYTGMNIIFPSAFFEDLQDPNMLKHGIPHITFETTSGDNVPLLLQINTVDDAPSGDYDINFIFTFSDGQNMYQDYKTTQIHVLSFWENFWERNQWWIQVVAVLIALISLMSGAFFSLQTYRKTRKRH